MSTRTVTKELYMNYLKKAEECFSAMNDEFAKGNYNSCVIAAIHCAISSADALTVFFKGVRHSGERHEDVIRLILSLELDKSELNRNIMHLSNLLSIKNKAEYEEKLTTQNGAFSALTNAERFFKWVKGIMKRG